MSNDTTMKYPEPRILLIDLEKDVSDKLVDAGFNVTSGSFGSPYRIHESTEWIKIYRHHAMPENVEEQQIVIVDLTAPALLDEPSGQLALFKDFMYFRVTGGQARESFDTRLFSMLQYREKFDRILKHGGIFIIFAQARVDDTIFVMQSGVQKETLSLNNWGFLSTFDNLETGRVSGEIINTAARSGVFAKYLADGKYKCTLHQKYRDYDDWVFLAANMYDDPVAALIRPKNQGFVFVLPQLNNKTEFLLEFLQEFLPQFAPEKSPYHVSRHWLDNYAYAMPHVRTIDKQIELVETEAENQIQTLQQQREAAVSEYSYLHRLLTESGDTLVETVIEVLRKLGFSKVIDVDAENSKSGDDNKDEDIRIEDISPMLLVEVKGVTNVSDEDVLQVDKYVAPRMRELNRTDIEALAIINHQRNKEPQERKNPFRDLHIENAEERHIGLLTTWELFRLAKGFIVNGWKHEYVRDIFYQDGLIDPLPSHYTYLGTIEKVWKKADMAGTVGIIPEKDFSVGATIAVVTPTDFLEQEVASLMVGDQRRDNVKASEQVGIALPFTQDLKEGYKMYLVVE